jgi:putative salt-induced outer membrane protein
MFALPICLAPLSLLAAAPALAQDAPASEWTGEGAFSAGNTTGNTETSDLGIAMKVKHQGDNWIQYGELSADYGETDSVESKNRIFAAGQVDRIFDDRLSGYGRLSWERDEFSGFENRYFLGVGAAWKAVQGETTNWTIEGGPGYKIDEIRETLTTPALTEESLGLRGGSKFEHKLNESVVVSNNSEVIYSEASTQLVNVLALTANLWGNLSARVSLDVRHDTDPLPDFEATDTATRVSLVYKVD